MEPSTRMVRCAAPRAKTRRAVSTEPSGAANSSADLVLVILDLISLSCTRTASRWPARPDRAEGPAAPGTEASPVRAPCSRASPRDYPKSALSLSGHPGPPGPDPSRPDGEDLPVLPLGLHSRMTLLDLIRRIVGQSGLDPWMSPHGGSSSSRGTRVLHPSVRPFGPRAINSVASSGLRECSRIICPRQTQGSLEGVGPPGDRAFGLGPPVGPHEDEECSTRHGRWST